VTIKKLIIVRNFGVFQHPNNPTLSYSLVCWPRSNDAILSSSVVHLRAFYRLSRRQMQTLHDHEMLFGACRCMSALIYTYSLCIVALFNIRKATKFGKVDPLVEYEVCMKSEGRAGAGNPEDGNPWRMEFTDTASGGLGGQCPRKWGSSCGAPRTGTVCAICHLVHIYLLIYNLTQKYRKCILIT